MKAPFFLYNGNLVGKNTPVVRAANRGLRYGDGVFETMRYRNGTITNWDFHMDRFFSSLRFLQYAIPVSLDAALLSQQVKTLAEANGLSGSARIRLMAFGSDGSIFQDENESPEVIIEAEPAVFADEMNTQGLATGLFTRATKNCDALANIKSNNYLPSILALKFARENKLDESILLNAFGRVAEASTANVFIIKNGLVMTPPLSEGCVNGTVRRWLLENQALLQERVLERKITVEEFKGADEIFLTNAITPLRWVEQFEGRIYSNNETARISECVYRHLH